MRAEDLFPKKGLKVSLKTNIDLFSHININKRLLKWKKMAKLELVRMLKNTPCQTQKPAGSRGRTLLSNKSGQLTTLRETINI